MLGTVALDQLDLLRARADDAHVAAQDVDELRQLVEAEAAQQPPHPGDARIGPQLEHRLVQLLEQHQSASACSASATIVRSLYMRKGTPRLPGAQLGEEHRAPAVELDRQRDEREQRGEDDQGARRDDHVEDALDQHVEREGSRVSYSSTGRSATSESRGAAPARPAQRRDDAQLHLLLATDPGELRRSAPGPPAPTRRSPGRASDELAHGRRPSWLDPVRRQVLVGDQMRGACRGTARPCAAPPRPARRRPAPRSAPAAWSGATATRIAPRSEPATSVTTSQRRPRRRS